MIVTTDLIRFSDLTSNVCKLLCKKMENSVNKIIQTQWKTYKNIYFPFKSEGSVSNSI